VSSDVSALASDTQASSIAALPISGGGRITKITREGRRKGGGAAFFAVVFKCLGILILLGSLITIALSLSAFFDTQASSNLTDTLRVFLSDAMLGASFNGFVAGLIIFGIGEIITLLNDIRRNRN
jgi:hypothetical protein